MDTEEQEEQAARKVLMTRKEGALEALNMRIARLAIALDMELETDTGLQKALEPSVTLEPHQRPFLEELRALLTLRYHMEKQLLDEVGNQTLHTIVDDVEQHMERIGFKRGVDGIHESQLFDDPN
ncbi:MAG: hypothetical protein HXX19_09040 [Rhodoferax sp.]|nr:hypothetical protein [Rhodoferax sp.]